MASNGTEAPGKDAEQHPLHQVAQKYWLKTKKTPSKVQPEVLKKSIWDELEKDDFSPRSLQFLENLQAFEKYLWPTFTDDASDYHVILIALLINVKRRENVPSWELFADQPSEFSTFFQRALSIILDTTLKPNVRTQTLVAIIGAFQSLDNRIIRQECAPLVSIAIWHNMSSETARQESLDSHAQFQKAWKAANRRYDHADDEGKATMRFQRRWLYSLLLDLMDILYNSARHSENDVLYCERVVELLCDLLSQFPTRRYVKTLLQELNLLLVIKRSPLYVDRKGDLLREQYVLLRHYMYFPIDDETGLQQSDDEVATEHTSSLSRLQRTALKHFKDKLTLLALSNHSSLSNKVELGNMLQPLSDEELVRLVGLMGWRAEYPNVSSIVVDRDFFLALVQTINENKATFKNAVKRLSLMPTEEVLYEDSFVRNETFDDTRSLAIPKLNLQYLTVSDFFWRSFILYRCEAFFEIKRDMEEAVKRMQPTISHTAGRTHFKGSSKLALATDKAAIIEVAHPNVGEDVPSMVKAEVILDISRANESLRKEWESLRPDDVVYLLSVPPQDNSRRITNGSSGTDTKSAPFRHLRCAEVLQVLDENGRPFKRRDDQENGYHGYSRLLRLMVNLDPIAYQKDTIEGEKERDAVYNSINLCVRRKSRENNFKPILETIRHMTLSDAPLPEWLQGAFLGLGDPSSVSYQNMADKQKSIDFRDTFLDWTHLRESLDSVIRPAEGSTQKTLEPPFVLTEASTEQAAAEETTSKRRKRGHDMADDAAASSTGSVPAAQTTQEKGAKGSRKRRRDEVDDDDHSEGVVEVSSYKTPNQGPYPTDAPRQNKIRFTKAQVEAIRSGTQPGLTLIVGPPGTGKTDVATQIINNIYHNFPTQRTLLIAHSNQALNQLFQKIVALDIDQRHLLRLGHGEEQLQLDGDASYSKSGRVEHFLENRDALLREVARLAASMHAPGAHGSSCETAEYFDEIYVKPAWAQFTTDTSSPDTTLEQIIDAFPFANFFSDAPQPLFPPSSTPAAALDIAAGCHRHISRIFSSLADIRPFEVLKTARDKSNYLLVSEARIVAMTTTHAAMRRREIADLGFRYDNVVIEEAAQVTEVEDVIPLALQRPDDAHANPVRRIIMLGDHLQNSPVVQSHALRTHAHLDQSLFQRLIRLGVPSYLLDAQGRARPSLAALYAARYPRLTDLPHTLALPAFALANPGLRYEYQFLDVPDFKGRGESAPSPHFIQNLGEAEYAVALYMYMRLLGYPAARITILTSYAGQRALVRDVLAHRCKNNRLFGMPGAVSTLDKYQGEQNDYVILSLTRTASPGFLRDPRRLTVALSRARLGLYVLGRRALFAQLASATPALGSMFSQLFARPTDALHVVTGEMWGATSREVGEEVESVGMEGVEHLGRYVFEMTEARVRGFGGGGEGGAGVAGERRDEEDGDEVDGEEGDGVGEEDNGVGEEEDGIGEDGV